MTQTEARLISRINSLPDVWDRNEADSYIRSVMNYREMARHELRWKLPAWRVHHRGHLRTAIRLFRRYARIVRSAQV